MKENLRKLIELTPVMFSESLTRKSLQENSHQLNNTGKQIAVQVWRNHAFEGVGHYVKHFSRFADLELSFSYSGYDDSFSFNGWQSSDIEILWVDPTRYLNRLTWKEFVKWISVRAETLRTLSDSPIIVCSWKPQTEASPEVDIGLDSVIDCHYIDIVEATNQDHMAFLDPRAADITGSLLSSHAQLEVARALGLQWIPASILPPLKAVIVDLDNTLYSGALGEDGPEKIDITAGHKVLQQYLSGLGKRGIFLGIASKNFHSDVQALWSSREDFVLKLEDFSAIEVSWKEKQESVRKICERLRISHDSVLFVDDNLGELVSVGTHLSEINLICANSNAHLTKKAIELFPGVFRWTSEIESSFRASDLKASDTRELMQDSSLDESDYFEALGVEIDIYVDKPEHLTRVAELVKKTNQFNLSLRRSSPSVLAGVLVSDNACIITASVQDRLSDSGLVFAMVVRRENSSVIVEELNLSCRALGRGIETQLIFECLKAVPFLTGHECIEFVVTEGPRNEPARSWLNSVAGCEVFETKTKIRLDTLKVLAFEPNKNIVFRRGE